MRKTIQTINKRSLSDATGISYGRLRKFASGQLKTLSEDEIIIIHNYLLTLASAFQIGDRENERTKL